VVYVPVILSTCGCLGRACSEKLYHEQATSSRFRRSQLAAEGFGRISKKIDGRYFLSLPKDLVEDTGFPFPVASSVRVKVRFKPGDKKLIIEQC